MIKRYLLFACVIIVLSSCEEPLTPVPSEKIRIETYQNGSSVLFARLPIFFQARKMNSFDLSQKHAWTFGNGASGNEGINSHTFDFPGTYKISVTTDGGSNYADTALVIQPPLKLIGSKMVAENGKAIFQNGNTAYSVIYYTDAYTSNTSRYRLLSASTNFDSLHSAPIPMETFPNATHAFVNKRNNIVILTSNILEIDRSGRVLTSVYPGAGFSPQQCIETTDGYLMAGVDFEATKLRIVRFNTSFEKLSETSIDYRDGYRLSMFHLESEDVALLHYVQVDWVSEDRAHMLVRKKISGEVLFEKTFTQENQMSYIFPLTSGYILAGVPETFDGQRKYLFTKVDFEGAIQWTSQLPTELLYPYFIHSGAVRVIERNGFIYIFADNQKVRKLTTAGAHVWTKQFGLFTDTFNSVLVNNAGNFVVLASHQFDYSRFEYTNDYVFRDLMLIEIDEDGNVVN